MKLLTVQLSKRHTEGACPGPNGHCFEIKDDVPLGKIYRVDMDSGKTGVCLDCGRIHKMVADADLLYSWLPMELLLAAPEDTDG